MNKLITADSPIKEITAEIRRQCRAIAKASGCKVSVTKSEYTGGRSVYVTITASERNHMCAIYRAFEKANPHTGMYDFVNPRNVAINRMHLADWAIELLAQLNSVVDSFNWDNSDSMTDYYHVNFYAHIDFCSKLDNAAKAEIDAELNEAEAFDKATEVTDETDKVADEVADKATHPLKASDKVEIGKRGTVGYDIGTVMDAPAGDFEVFVRWNNREFPMYDGSTTSESWIPAEDLTLVSKDIATDEATDEAIDDLESLGVDELRELLERETARRKEIETQVLRADLIKKIEDERQHIRILEGRLNG